MERGRGGVPARAHGALALTAAVALAACGGRGAGGAPDGGAPDGGSPGPDALAPLSTVPVPAPVGGDVVDAAAAVRLGKALFWDVQAGSDGQVACATCHYRAGADSRRTNTLHPGPDDTFQTGGVTAAGQFLPPVNVTSDDRVGSQGMPASVFVSLDADPTVASEVCTPASSTLFGTERLVTDRNAPSVIGAVFYRESFWDGRASDLFNREDIWGAASSPGPYVANSSLASQAVAPPVAPGEMTCFGRPLAGPTGLAAKLLARTPLGHQLVAPDDSVLGVLSAAPANGLRATYADLVAAAFGPAAAAAALDRFPALWAQALQAYEATLVPDRTPLDRDLAGDATALSDRQRAGLALFRGKARCASCHAGPELTDASVGFAARHGLVNGDGGDQGYHNTGVRPTGEDLGRSGLGFQAAPISRTGAAADRGAFKTPALRDVGLTAPYFHNGGKATLADVVDFYDVGGDFANVERSSLLRPLGLSADERDALVDFLANALTDCRVAAEAAPFDHPSLTVPNGPALPATGAGGNSPCP